MPKGKAPRISDKNVMGKKGHRSELDKARGTFPGGEKWENENSLGEDQDKMRSTLSKKYKKDRRLPEIDYKKSPKAKSNLWGGKAKID